MPELPEVETVARDLRDSGILSRRIQEVRIYWPRSIAGISPQTFAQKLKGVRLSDISRYGKYLILHCESHYLLIHLRMSGRVELKKSAHERDKHEHVIFRFDHGLDLRFRDTRKFGRLYLVKDTGLVLSKLGPDPVLGPFEAAEFLKRIRVKKRQMKALLLDQSFVAGLGNIYVDEALWRARIHPLVQADQLKDAQILALHEAILYVLRQGIAHRGTSIGFSPENFYSLKKRYGGHQSSLQVFRKTGQPCPRCSTAIRRIKVVQRSTHFCPQCQVLS